MVPSTTRQESSTPASSGPSEMASPSTALSTPGAYFQAFLPQYRRQLPALLDAILSRECLAFCPISRDDFLHDLESDAGAYYSSALTDALLALATLLLPREQLAPVTAPPLPPAAAMTTSDRPPDDLGNAFAEEAIAALYNGTGLPQRIADIQALGILSLYCLGCGKMKDAQGFAGDFGAAITGQWRDEQPLRSETNSSADKQAHANVYCAAISLNRYVVLCSNLPPFQRLLLVRDCRRLINDFGM